MVSYFNMEPSISTEDWIRFHRADCDFDWDSYNDYYIEPTVPACPPWSHYEENFDLKEDPDIQWYDNGEECFDWDGYWGSVYEE